jgi:hypothetical protein
LGPRPAWGKNGRSYLKNNLKNKVWGDVVQMVAPLPSKHKAVSSNSRTEKTKRRKKYEGWK